MPISCSPKTCNETTHFEVISAKQFSHEKESSSFIGSTTLDPEISIFKVSTQSIGDSISEVKTASKTDGGKRKRDTDDADILLEDIKCEEIVTTKRLRRNALVPNGPVAEVVKDVCLQFQLEAFCFSDSSSHVTDHTLTLTTEGRHERRKEICKFDAYSDSDTSDSGSGSTCSEVNGRHTCDLKSL